MMSRAFSHRARPASQRPGLRFASSPMDASNVLFYAASSLCWYLNDVMIYEAHADLLYIFPFHDVGLP